MRAGKPEWLCLPWVTAQTEQKNGPPGGMDCKLGLTIAGVEEAGRVACDGNKAMGNRCLMIQSLSPVSKKKKKKRVQKKNDL